MLIKAHERTQNACRNREQITNKWTTIRNIRNQWFRIFARRKATHRGCMHTLTYTDIW
jgi:hypothetical protein